MTSRAALLPWASDPYLLNFWLKGFRRIWGGEVDRLYVYCSFPLEEAAVEFAKSLCDDPKIVFIYPAATITHGVAIKNILEQVEEEYVMLIEDDAFILRYGVISECFRVLEEGKYDLVASPRGSCSFEILNRGAELWGTVDTGGGDNGCNFWPCFFFSKKQTLLDTDRQFDPQDWGQGEYIPALQWTAPCDVRGDTFVNTSLQLRAKIPPSRILIIPQFHSYITDEENYRNNAYIFNGKCPWFHVGSLSTGAHGVLMDNDNRPLTERTFREPNGESVLPPYPVDTDQERGEWQRRVAWWLTFVEESPKDVLQEFRELYAQAVERVIRGYALHRKTITTRQTIFKKIMKGYYDQT